MAEPITYTDQHLPHHDLLTQDEIVPTPKKDDSVVFCAMLVGVMVIAIIGFGLGFTAVLVGIVECTTPSIRLYNATIVVDNGAAWCNGVIIHSPIGARIVCSERFILPLAGKGFNASSTGQPCPYSRLRQDTVGWTANLDFKCSDQVVTIITVTASLSAAFLCVLFISFVYGIVRFNKKNHG